MATPPDFATSERIITMALRDAGKIARDQIPDSSYFLEGMERLQDLLAFYQTRGIKLWQEIDTTVPMVAGTAVYTFGPSGSTVMNQPFRVDYAYAIDQNSETRRPLDPISWAEWVRLSTIAQQGQVTQYFVNKQLTNLEVSLWQTPDATAVLGEVHLVFRSRLTHISNLTDTIQFPPEWLLPLRWGLADEFASGAPEAVQIRCASRAQTYLTELEGFDIEDTGTQPVPDSQGSGGGGRFM